MTDLTNLTTPFGLLDEVYGPGTKEAFKAHGGPYQWLGDEGWAENARPAWFFGTTYRVKPQPPKPRDGYVLSSRIYDTLEEFWAYHGPDATPVHVREVLP